MRVNLAIKRLRDLYPDSEIRTVTVVYGRMIVKDDTFLAWICDGEVDTALIQYLEKGQRISSS